MNNAIFHKKTMENVRKQRYWIWLNIKKILNMRYQTCQNRKKKKVFGVRTKLWYYKDFYRISISNRNEKDWNTYE